MATTTARPSTTRWSLWDRELTEYPKDRTRFLCLGIVVLATIVLYYQYYLAGAIATHIMTDLHMSFAWYVNMGVVGYIFGAAASFFTGIADKYGRANIVVVGLLLVALLCLIGVPASGSRIVFGTIFTLIGVVEGIILVATPALIRDFSPQLGRASAMGFWTLGPVLGSLVVSLQVSNSSDTTPWKHHYMVAGVVGLVMTLVAAAFLRELAPGLRDQLMVSERDRALIEARAKGIDVEGSLQRPLRQMLKPDIVLSALAISVFLIIYYAAVGFFPVYFQTIFGFTQSKANGLGNLTWGADAVALILIGLLSDKLRVRKPFMVVGALVAAGFTIAFLTRATHPDTSYTTFEVLVALMALGLGIAYAPWMASFTETVERRNPALTATGLAVWGLVIRIVIAVSVFILPLIVTTATTLVEKGPVAQEYAAKYSTELATAAKLDPATSAALTKDPNDAAAGAKAVSEISGVPVGDVTTVATLNAQHGDALAAAAALDPATAAALLADPTDKKAGAAAVGQISAKLGVSAAEATSRLQELATIPSDQLALVARDGTKITDASKQLAALGKVPAADLALLQKVSKASEDSPHQWQTYYWIAVGGELVFIPFVFLMAGFWSPRRAKRHEEEHEAWLEEELRRLSA